jgi:hypothetical protein
MEYVDLLEQDAHGLIRIAARPMKRYEIKQETPVIILIMAGILKEKFAFSTQKPVSAMDEMVIACVRGELELLLGWDGGTGIFVRGRNRSGDTRAEEFSFCLSGLLDEQVFEGYIQPVRSEGD